MANRYTEEFKVLAAGLSEDKPILCEKPISHFS